MELAVNMPEHEPQVGQAERSTSARSASLTLLSAAIDHGVDQVEFLEFTWVPCSARRVLPASIGPPETNTTGC